MLRLGIQSERQMPKLGICIKSEFFREIWLMQSRFLHRDVSAFASSIRQCTAIGNLSQAQDCHTQLLQSRHNTNVFLANLVINMYTRCGSLAMAKEVFDGIAVPNAFSWNAMLSSYTRHRQLNRARELFEEMPDKDVVSWNLMLKANAQAGDIAAASIVFYRMTSRNVISWTSVLGAFSQSGHIAEAESVFQKMPQHDAIAGNAMVTAYAQHGHIRDAYTTFESMPIKDEVSWNLMLQAFAVNASPEDAMAFFESVPCRNVVSWNALLAAFAQRGRLLEASRTFDMLPQLELASWNTMITAFANTGHLSRGRELFETMPEFDIISWNTLIAGYAESASYRTAMDLFQQLNLEGLHPTESTFVGLLVGCNRGGKVNRAHDHFISMIAMYGLKPELDHYGCMVEVLGRAKHLDLAEELLHQMPVFPGPVAWTSYLSSCRMHGDFKRAAQAAEHLIDLDPENKSMYQLLVNMYTEKAAEQQRRQEACEQKNSDGNDVDGESMEQRTLTTTENINT